MLPATVLDTEEVSLWDIQSGSSMKRGFSCHVIWETIDSPPPFSFNRLMISWIEQGNGLEAEWGEVEFAISNPPFALPVKDWNFTTKEFPWKKKHKSEIAFIEKALHQLRPGGKLTYIVPGGILCNSYAQQWRESILKEHRYLGTISLPPETFYQQGTSISTSIMLIEKGRTTEEDYNVFFGIVEDVGWTSRGKPTRKGELDEITKAYLSFEEQGYNENFSY